MANQQSGRLGGLSTRSVGVAVCVGILLGASVFYAQRLWLAPESAAGGTNQGSATSDSTVGSERGRDDWMCLPKKLPPRVVWNRIYKTGGVDLARFMHAVANRNDFTYARSNIFDFFATQRSDELRMEIAVGVTTADFPDGQLGGKAVQLHGQALRSEEGKPTTALLYDQSMAFVDYTQWGLPQPEYINWIRHPLERAAQNFEQMQRFHAKRPQDFPCTHNVTLNQCLEQRRTRSCMVASSCGANNLMTHTMCGNSGVCTDPSSKEALELALYNMQYRYAVVGIVEFLPTSLELMERVLPGYFAGLPTIVRRSNMYKSPNMPSADTNTPRLDAANLSEENLRYFAEHNANDVRLYRAAVRLLHRRAAACEVDWVSTNAAVASLRDENEL